MLEKKKRKKKKKTFEEAALVYLNPTDIHQQSEEQSHDLQRPTGKTSHDQGASRLRGFTILVYHDNSIGTSEYSV